MRVMCRTTMYSFLLDLFRLHREGTVFAMVSVGVFLCLRRLTPFRFPCRAVSSRRVVALQEPALSPLYLLARVRVPCSRTHSRTPSRSAVSQDPGLSAQHHPCPCSSSIRVVITSRCRGRARWNRARGAACWNARYSFGTNYSRLLVP